MGPGFVVGGAAPRAAGGDDRPPRSSVDLTPSLRSLCSPGRGEVQEEDQDQEEVLRLEAPLRRMPPPTREPQQP